MRWTYILGGMLVVVFLLVGFVTRVPSLSAHHGMMDTHLFLSDGPRQPLVVAFGGGSGGNDWERRYLKPQRDSLLAHGFALLAIGYFKTENSPETLDRISLNAIADTIFNIAQRHPQIDASRIILMGGSKGGELVLNLASRFPQFKCVVALSTSHVSFPALTVAANTSSWQYNGQEVTYVPAPFDIIIPAIKGNLYEAFSIMLENKEAVKHAEIEVEKINGPILMLSGKADEQWPATEMSDQMMKRLARHHFKHRYRHLAFEGGHAVPLQHMDSVWTFLQAELAR
ncbi:MAG: acyl-CoA thioester hydrolase/BAAT C-terminal domain-containing protein [Flammeovirgaceae bacterium]